MTSAGSSGSEERGIRNVEKLEQVAEDAVALGGAAKIGVPGRAAGADLAADHALHHQGMTVAPERQGLVDVHQQRKQAERLLHRRHLAIDRDEQGRLHGPRRKPPRLGALVRLEDGGECREGLVDAAGLLLATLGREHGLDGFDIRGEVPHHRGPVRHTKRLAAPIEERRARQPGVEQRQDGRAPARRREPLAIGDRKAFLDRLAVEWDARALGQAEPRLDQPELQRLEAGSREQVVAEIEEIRRRHGLQHIELRHQQLEDLVDAGQRMDDARHRAVIDRIGREIPLDAVEFMQDLPEPQLVSLVHDDEQHLVVHRRPVLGALRRLQGQQPVDLQIVGVVDGRAGHERLCLDFIGKLQINSFCQNAAVST